MPQLFDKIGRLFRKDLTPAEVAINGRQVDIIGGNVQLYDSSKTEYIRKGFEYNDILYSIVKLIVEKAKIAPIAPYQVEDEQALKQLEFARKQLHIPDNVTKAKELFHKALKPITNDSYLRNLFEYPNAEDTMEDLNEQLYGFKLVTGDWYEYWQLAEGGLNTGLPMTLSALPANYMIITSSNSLPMSALMYRLNLSSGLTFTPAEILHEKYFNLDWTVPGMQLYGMSPLRAGLRRLQRNNEAQIAGLSSFRNGGARGIITPDTTDVNILRSMTWEQLGAVKQRIDDEIGGGSRAANRTAVLNAPYKYTQIGFSPVDLALLESEQVDLRSMCNWYGVPSQLMNDPANKTYANQQEGEKALTLRCALPLVNSRVKSMTRKFRQTDKYKNSRIVIDYDQTVYTELEVNRKEQAEWIRDSPHLTLRMRYNIQNLEIPPNIPDDVLDTVFLPNNWIPATDLIATSPDITKDLNALDKLNITDY